MTGLLQDMPIRRKLMFTVLLSVGVALLIAAVVANIYQWLALRSELINDVNNQVSLISINSTTAILSGDKKSATITLGEFKSIEYIEFVVKHDKADQPFAIYGRAGETPSLPQIHTPAVGRYVFSAAHLDAYIPVFLNSEKIATVHVRASLMPFYMQMAQGVLVMILTALCGLGVAYVLIRRMSPAISGPIENLAGLMRSVSTEKNYALRSALHHKDEIGALAEGFNNMLEKIQARDSMLEQHRANLEQEVARRTSSLTEAQRIAHIGNWEWDIVQNKLAWSAEIYHIFGLAPHQFGATYEAFLQAVHPEDRHLVDKQVREALENMRPYSIDHRILRPDGSVRYVREQAEVICSADGKPARMLGTVHDITDSWLAETALAGKEKRFRELVEQSSDWIWEISTQLIYSYVSPQCKAILGYEVDEVIGKSPFDLMLPEEAPRVSALFQKSLQAQQAFLHLECIHLHKDGHQVVLETNGVPIFGLNGEFIGYRGMNRDVTERVRTEAMLHESEEKFRAIFDRTLDGIVLADAKTQQLTASNPALCQMLGYSSGETSHLFVADIHPQQDLPHVLEQFAKQLRGEIQIAADIPVKRKDGSIFYADINSALMSIGGKDYLVGIFRDITERKRAEESIRNSQVRFSTIFKQAPLGIALIESATGKIDEVNARFAAIIGRSIEEMESLDWMSVTHPDDVQKDLDQMGLMSAGKISGFNMNKRYIRPDGSLVWVNMTIASLNIANAISPHHLCMIEDISERKLLENELQQSEARYRSIFEHTDDLIFLLAQDGTFNSLSPSFEGLTGWTTAEWIGKPFAPIIHPEDIPRALEVFQNTLAGQSKSSFELRVVKKSGEYLNAELSSVPAPAGGEISVIGIARDVTERKQIENKIRQINEELEAKVQERTKQLQDAQEELVRKEKLAVLGQVAGSVGHELRNPLGVMSNAVYFLQAVLPDADETTKEYLAIINNEIGVADRIVGDLLDSVRSKPPQPQRIGMAELIAQTLLKCDVPANVSVQQDIPDTLPPLWVDPLQVGQVFRNLFSNGIEAMLQGGTLAIRASENPLAQTITISVQDSGIGLAPEVLSKLFQPLFTTKARGIGLGLVVVKNLTQNNGGKIEVTSVLGKGTTFMITLPCAAGHAEA